MSILKGLSLAIIACLIPALSIAQSSQCASITCNHLVSSSGVNLTKSQAQSSYITAMNTEVSTHSNAACSAWCAQQNDGACSNGTYTHHHPAGDTGVTCTSTTVGGGNGGTVGGVADSLIGGLGGSLIKKLAKASDTVKHWTCSRSFHFTCDCSGEVVTPNETQTTLEQQMTSDPLLQQ